jgi:hypothetical protein
MGANLRADRFRALQRRCSGKEVGLEGLRELGLDTAKVLDFAQAVYQPAALLFAVLDNPVCNFTVPRLGRLC